MTNDKDLEIQILFLEKASAHLNTLESVLLEAKDKNQSALQNINTAQKAAYSIQCGARMIGFRILSDLAHRLEDVFTLLKIRNNLLEIDTDLYSLLLSGVDWLRQIINLYSEGHTVDEQWLAAFCYPVFEELHELMSSSNENEFQVKCDKFVEQFQKTEHPENSHRVGVTHLEQVNDMFGELAVQPLSLEMQLERLYKLMRHLGNRVKNIERENHQLHLAYAKLTQAQVQNDCQPDSSFKRDCDHKTVMETIVKIQEITTDIQLSLEDTNRVNCLLNKTAQQLQQSLTQVQMRPLSALVERFPRALHNMSVEYGKNVQLKIEGANTLIEDGILEALNEPLMHLLRNAFEYSIEDPATRRACGKPEQGLIEIKATHHGNRTLITVRDDGRGLWRDKIRTRKRTMELEDSTVLTQAIDGDVLSLTVESEFSPSTPVTALSYCSLAMNAVCRTLKLLQGEIQVDTVPGVGTTFTLSVPFKY